MTPDPELWTKITVGSVVLACHKEGEGWWPAVVLAIKGGDKLQVRWNDDSADPKFTTRRDKLGLIHPKAD